MIVYALVDPRDRSVRYVGETARSGSRRLAQHVRTAKAKTTPPVNAWIRGMLNEGVTPEMIEIDRGESKSDVCEREAYWIEQLRAMGAKLLNIAPGGSTRVGYRHSEETRKRWCENRRGENHPMFGKRRTDEQKQMFRELTKELWQRRPHPGLGKKRSPETIEKMRAARTGRPISKEHAAALAAGRARRWAEYRANKAGKNSQEA